MLVARNIHEVERLSTNNEEHPTISQLRSQPIASRYRYAVNAQINQGRQLVEERGENMENPSAYLLSNDSKITKCSELPMYGNITRMRSNLLTVIAYH